MSSNHTHMSSTTYKALEDEILRLQEGDPRPMREAEKKVQDALRDLQQSGRQHLQGLSQERQASIDRIRQASDRILSALTQAKGGTASLDSQMNVLQGVIRQSTDQVQKLVNDTRRHNASATQLYAEVTRQLALCEANADYAKFTSGQLLDLRTRLNAMAGREMESEAAQMITINALNDLFLMDIQKERLRTQYEMQHLEAIRTAHTIQAHIENVKKNNRADLDDASSELLDIDYWTRGEYAIVERDVHQLLDRITAGRTDANYSQRILQSDLQRLQELDKLEHLLVARGREAYNHSENRKVQAQTCGDILAEHGYSIVGEGFDCNDRRGAYVMRLRRHTSGAEVEVIVNQGEREGDYDVYFRIDAKTFMDEQTMRILTESIAQDFQQAGVSMKMFRHCTAETLEPFNPTNIRITDATRRRHGIVSR